MLQKENANGCLWGAFLPWNNCKKRHECHPIQQQNTCDTGHGAPTRYFLFILCNKVEL